MSGSSRLEYLQVLTSRPNWDGLGAPAIPAEHWLGVALLVEDVRRFVPAAPPPEFFASDVPYISWDTSVYGVELEFVGPGDFHWAVGAYESSGLGRRIARGHSSDIRDFISRLRSVFSEQSQ